MIATMRRRGLSIPTVARQFERTPAGIQSALRTRGWVDPHRSKLMSSVRVFSLEQREAFREFVRSRAAGHTPSDIRDEWNQEATTKRWPIVNNERVIYYLRELGLQKTKSEYVQFASYRRKQSIAQRNRRAKEREARRRVLRTRRAELYACESDQRRRTCQVCRETWPLTEEFFHHAGNSVKYFLNTCRICCHSLKGTAAERRAQRMLAYDRQVVVKEISAAKAERDAFLNQHRTFPTLKCSRCHEVWELLAKRFPKYKPANGGELYRRICRFCLRASERLKERERKALLQAPNRNARL
jgi:SLT domain-containing protein